MKMHEIIKTLADAGAPMPVGYSVDEENNYDLAAIRDSFSEWLLQAGWTPSHIRFSDGDGWWRWDNNPAKTCGVNRTHTILLTCWLQCLTNGAQIGNWLGVSE